VEYEVKKGRFRSMAIGLKIYLDLSPSIATERRLLSYMPTDLRLLPPVNSSFPNELRRQEIIEWE
jgi:hypothetical protein